MRFSSLEWFLNPNLGPINFIMRGCCLNRPGVTNSMTDSLPLAFDHHFKGLTDLSRKTIKCFIVWRIAILHESASI